MGCNKSKSQHGGTEADVDGGHMGSSWELGQEPHSLYGENLEFNQNRNSSSSFHSEPRVKRISSDVNRDKNSADVPNNEHKLEKEENNYNKETKTSHESIGELKYDGHELLSICGFSLFPEEWSSLAIGKTGLADISLTSAEGKSVLKYFSRTSQSKDFKLTITQILRVENPYMHSYYLLKKQEMESRNEHVDELYLYHGTKKEYLPAILEDNLNWRKYSEKHRFGQGVSFSPLATYSSHYGDRTPERVMLLFKVLISNSIGGSPDMKIPPVIGSIVYDTSIKDDTSVVVKYSDNEFYPLYQINYVKIMRKS